MEQQRRNTIVALVTVCVVVVPLLVLFFSIRQARRAGPFRIRCMNNLRQVALGLALYADDHDDFLPPADSAWAERLAPYVDQNGPDGGHRGVFVCPVHLASPSYGINARLGGSRKISEITESDATVTIAESDRAVMAGLDDVAFDRHRRRANVLFADTHVECIMEGALQDRQFDVRIVAPR